MEVIRHAQLIDKAAGSVAVSLLRLNSQRLGCETATLVVAIPDPNL